MAIGILASVLVVAPLVRPAAAAPADHLTITTVVTNMRAGTMFNVQVVARDAGGAVDTGFNGSISINAAATGGSNFPGGAFTVSASGGSVTVFGLVLNNAADGYTLTASSAGLSNGVSNSFNITARRLMVTSTTTNMPAGTPFGMQVGAFDGNNTIAENFNGNVVLNADADGGSNFSGGSKTAVAAAGSASFGGLTLPDAADNYSITATAIGVSAGFSDTFNVTATHLAVAPVANARSGDPFDVTVEARDANDTLAENFSGAVNIDAAATGGSNFAGGTAAAVSDAGTATFAGVALNNAANGYTVAASSAGLAPAVSGAFDVTARQLVVATNVANVQAGTPFSATVEARDADNNVAENFGAAIALDAAATGGANFNGGTQNAAATGGVALFSALGLNDAADGYTINANSSGLTGASSNPFNVTASHLSMSPVANMRSGDPFNVSVDARDGNDNVAENFTGSVNLDASATGGSNFAGGTASANASAGTANFDNLVLNDSADGYVVSAGAAGLANGASNSFNVTASQLVVTNAIANVQAGTPFTVQVEARDANDATAENFTATVALDAAATGGANFTGGTQSSPASGGAATFGNVVLDTAADGYTVTASAPGVTSGTSNSFNVSAGRPDISISDASVLEGNAGSTGATFTVTLSQAATGVVTVNFATSGGSASSGTDFMGGSGTVTFAPGVTSQSITVSVKGDLLNEADETFVVDLSGAVNANIAKGQGVGTIRNDDPMPLVFALPAVAIEGSLQPRTAVVTVRLSAPSGQQVAVSFQTVDGTAVDGVGEASADYTARTGTLVFAPGQTQQTITVLLRNDLVVEPDEYFVVDLRSPVNALVVTPRTVVLVIDDDAPARQLLLLGEHVQSLDLDMFRTANLLGNLRLNCGHLQQFARDIGRYRGAQIAPADAEALTAAANRLRTSIGCPV